MKVLIGCEESGTLRDALRRRGVNAVSCDIKPSRTAGPHIQGDIFEAIAQDKWDALIAFPDCTYLANSGAKHMYIGCRKENGLCKGRQKKREAAARFFKRLLTCGIPRIAVENPIMLGCAKRIIGRNHTQIIQPWQFGHGETKATCLWLTNLPKLAPTDVVSGREQKVHKMAPGPNRKRDRSKTYKGIAEAMADQWFNYIGERNVEESV